MKKVSIPGALLLLLFMPVIALADARTDYNANCAGCHGSGGMPTSKMAKILKVDIKSIALSGSSMNKDKVIALIEKGRGKMPAFKGTLTKEQIDAVADYAIGLRYK